MGPTPPPQYSNPFNQHPANLPGPPNAGLEPQKFLSEANASYPAAPGHRLPDYQENSLHSSRGQSFGGGHVSSSDEHHVYQHRRGMYYRKGPASQSSSSSCASSSRDQYASMQSRRQYGGENKYQENLSLPPPPPFSGPGNRSLSGVVENDCNFDEKEHYLNQYSSAPPFSNSPQVTTAHLLDSSSAQHQSGATQDTSDVSTGSANAASCDSGLPPEEADPTIIDQKIPLINRPHAQVQYKSPLRVTTPRKQM